MATAVKCVNTISWKGVFRKPGEVVLDMDDAEAIRLSKMKAVTIQNPTKAQAAATTDASK